MQKVVACPRSAPSVRRTSEEANVAPLPYATGCWRRSTGIGTLDRRRTSRDPGAAHGHNLQSLGFSLAKRSPYSCNPHGADGRAKTCEEALMERRRACTSGGVVVVTRDGTSRSVPAGPCWIRQRASPRDPPLVGWTEREVEYHAELTDDVFRSYLSGCMLQYLS